MLERLALSQHSSVSFDRYYESIVHRLKLQQWDVPYVFTCSKDAEWLAAVGPRACPSAGHKIFALISVLYESAGTPVTAIYCRDRQVVNTCAHVWETRAVFRRRPPCALPKAWRGMTFCSLALPFWPFNRERRDVSPFRSLAPDRARPASVDVQ